MKKDVIYDLCYSINDEWNLDKEKGYIDQDKQIGYAKREGLSEKDIRWVSTCLISGLSIAEGKTRKECIEKTNNLWDKIQERRQSNKLKKYINIFNKLKENLREKEVA